MERFEFRKAAAIEDRFAVQELLRKIFIFEKSLFSETTLDDFSLNYDCLAVFFEGHPIAAACFAMTGGNHDVLEIKCFAVAAEFRRQGVGRTLMKRIIENAGENPSEVLSVDTLAGARPFFISFGFREIEKPRIMGSNAFVRMHKEFK